MTEQPRSMSRPRPLRVTGAERYGDASKSRVTAASSSSSLSTSMPTTAMAADDDPPVHRSGHDEHYDHTDDYVVSASGRPLNRRLAQQVLQRNQDMPIAAEDGRRPRSAVRESVPMEIDLRFDRDQDDRFAYVADSNNYSNDYSNSYSGSYADSNHNYNNGSKSGGGYGQVSSSHRDGSGGFAQGRDLYR
jgi:hypothetical protein